jgi:DNA mismatch repair protein MutL
MPIIKLPEDVSSKIAAGEVVERPASVVKELIENSIDAGSREIHIRIEDAGKKLIEIIDDGTGIESIQSEIALQRYATSKIAVAEDLERIRTLGFRGEALASIAAVSRFTMESRVESENEGFRIQFESGEKKSKQVISRSIGTLTRVEDLFYNVPARLKFLKKDITENRQIGLLVKKYALLYANIRFSLLQDGKRFLITNGSGNKREVLSQIYDLETAKSFLEVDYKDEYVEIEGFTSPLNITRSSRKEIFFFVNGRLVNDPMLTSAVTKAYQGLMMVGRYPIANIFINLDPKEVDVNVHPTKAEIRLQDANRVFVAIQRIIRKTISAYAPFPTIPSGIWKSSPQSIAIENIELDFGEHKSRQGEENLSPKEVNNPTENATAGKLHLLRTIGQLGLTYIAAEGPDGLYLIDQHAAHERVLFERMMVQSDEQKASQLLLEPVVVHFPKYQTNFVDKYSDLLFEIGFDLEQFGPDAFKILAVPKLLISFDAKDTLLSIIDGEDDQSNSNMVEFERKEKLISRICKRFAVKGGQTLSLQEQVQLIRDLESCKNPRTCPHGRPTMIHISVDVLEKQFGRKGSI